MLQVISSKIPLRNLRAPKHIGLDVNAAIYWLLYTSEVPHGDRR
jgi:hypothetical protein